MEMDQLVRKWNDLWNGDQVSLTDQPWYAIKKGRAKQWIHQVWNYVYLIL